MQHGLSAENEHPNVRTKGKEMCDRMSKTDRDPICSCLRFTEFYVIVLLVKDLAKAR